MSARLIVPTAGASMVVGKNGRMDAPDRRRPTLAESAREQLVGVPMFVMVLVTGLLAPEKPLWRLLGMVVALLLVVGSVVMTVRRFAPRTERGLRPSQLPRWFVGLGDVMAVAVLAAARGPRPLMVALAVATAVLAVWTLWPGPRERRG